MVVVVVVADADADDGADKGVGFTADREDDPTVDDCTVLEDTATILLAVPLPKR